MMNNKLRVLRIACAPGVVMLFTIVSASVSAAQSDGSLEDAYARECQQHQDTDLCNSLRTTMTQRAAITSAQKPVQAGSVQDDTARIWGDFSRLPGTFWRDSNGRFYHYSWQEPGETLLVEVTGTANGSIKLQRKYDDSVETANSAGEMSQLSFPRPGLAIQESALRQRTTFRFSPGVIRYETETFVDGAWKPSASGERQQVDEAAFTAAKNNLAARERAVTSKWGALLKLGGYWTDGSVVWEGFWKSPPEFVFNVYATDGEYWNTFRWKEKNGRIEGSDMGGNYYPMVVLPDGSVFVDGTDDAFILRSPTQFDFQNGRMEGGTFVPKSNKAINRNGSFRKMSQAEGLAFRQQRERYMQASKGDSGLFGALAMATGAALAGGNAEVVMGAAMKGAELTTSNEGTRRVLDGQGDAMIASGVQSMTNSVASPSYNAQNGVVQRPAASSTGASASVAGNAGTSAPPARRKIWGWCYATRSDGRAAYMSGVGSRDLSVDEQEQWRSEILGEFRQQISGSYDHAQCDIDDDSDFSYTRGNVEAHNPARVPWSPR